MRNMMRDAGSAAYRVGFVLAVMGLATASPRLAAVHGADAEKRDASLLQAERWSVASYGLSLQPPKHTRPVEQAADGSIVKFVGEEATFSLYLRTGGGSALTFGQVKRQGRAGREGRVKPHWEQQTTETQSDQPLTRKFLRKRGKHQFSFLYPRSVQLKDPQPNLTVAGHKATKIYFFVSQKQDDWVAGQAYVILTKKKIAVFQLECDADGWQKHKRRFEAMVRSTRIADLEKLGQRRSHLLQAAHQWRQSLSPQQIKAVLNADPQWFRIQSNGKDVGYMQVTRQTATELGENGVRLIYKKRLLGGAYVYDTVGRLFVAFDGRTEVWSRKTTRRPKKQTPAGVPTGQGEGLAQPGRAPRQASWIETGVHDDEQLRVQRIAPATGFNNQGAVRRARDNDRQTWAIPETAYLSQAGARLLMPLLPHEKKRTMLFYSYSPIAGKLSLRRIRIRPLKGDRYAVRIKPTSARPERLAIYSSDGRLIRKRMADGLVYKPATRKQMREAWNLK